MRVSKSKELAERLDALQAEMESIRKELEEEENKKPFDDDFVFKDEYENKLAVQSNQFKWESSRNEFRNDRYTEVFFVQGTGYHNSADAISVGVGLSIQGAKDLIDFLAEKIIYLES